MPISLSKPTSRYHAPRWVMTALLIYGAICIGLFGYFIIYPDEATQKSLAEESRLVKQGRYEGLVANWAHYRARNLRAEAR